jgi:N-methylhydantoinase B
MPGKVLINPGCDNEREIKPLSDGTIVHKGDLIRIITPGGGGWGCPLDRPPNEVLDDFLDGYISAKNAEQQYGVVFTIDQTKVNWDETEKLRASQIRPAEMFHRERYYNAEADRVADLS